MLPSGGVIINFRKPLFIRFALFALFLFFFWQRLSVLITSLSTFVVFTFKPAPVLGNGDGWDLVNLISPPNASLITPRIIHHVRLGNLTMKPKWIEANTSCVELNKPEDGWRYELWDTERANAFVAEEYPQLLDTFLGYKQGTQQFCCVATIDCF
jgi:inositol phosphorylceramide mannosyltransferase catalytic subunit